MAISRSVFAPRIKTDSKCFLLGPTRRHNVTCSAASNAAKRNLVSDCVVATSVAFALAMKGGGAKALAADIVKTPVINKGMSMALASSWTGFAAGCLHTLTGVDHLAALAPLCIGRSNRLVESASLGALWGCGHDVGHIMFGILFLLLRDKLKIEVLRVWGSRVVGLTLMVIGAVGIKEALADADAEIIPVEQREEQDVKKSSASSSLLFTFGTGLVYGMQPDALLMVLPALAMPSRLAGLLFLGMFSLGTVVSMSSYTLFLASCSDVLHKRLPKLTRNLSWISSMIAIVFGMAVLCGEILGLSIF